VLTAKIYPYNWNIQQTKVVYIIMLHYVINVLYIEQFLLRFYNKKGKPKCLDYFQFIILLRKKKLGGI